MPPKNKILLLTFLVFFSLSFFTIKDLKASPNSTSTLSLSNGIGENITGDYDGDLSLVYFEFNSDWNSWWYQNRSTNIISHNISVNEKEFVLNRLEIYADNIINETGSGDFVIADNITNQFSPAPSYLFAQQFTAHDLYSIDVIWLYLNYSVIMIPELSNYYMVLHIFNGSGPSGEEIDVIWNYESRPMIDEWVPFHPRSNIFAPGEKYFFMLHLWSEKSEEGDGILFDFWKAENHKSSSSNKGLSVRFNGHTWLPIVNDDSADFLCYFSYKKLINPALVDLKYIINDQTIIPNYQRSSFGLWGYEAYLSYTLDSQINSPVNVTVITNQTIPTLEVYIEKYYVHIVNASGTYSVDDNYNEWTIEYYYEEISFGWPPPIFLFERDWDFVEFFDPHGVPMNDIYFGPMDLYNKSYYGVTDFFGPPLERGIYTGIFNSPNYCNKINFKAQSGSQFLEQSSLELGQIIRLEAEIFNPFNQPMSGGNGSILLKSPSGSIVLNDTGLSAINGILTSSELNLNAGEGFYEAIIFWTNGQEIAYYSVSIQVEDPAKLIMFIVIIIGAAVVSVPLALVARRQLKQRNWKKSLKNLFVLTKDGVSLYEFSFGIEIQDPALISAMIAALTNFVREATGSKKALRTVDQEDKKVILYHGDYVTVALLADRDLPIIHKRIKRFTESFEEQYGIHLKSWTGETTMFKGTEILLSKEFPLDVEEQVIRGVKQKLLDFRQQLDMLKDPAHIISLMKHINDFISRYQSVVNAHYINYYFEIIKIAEEKMSLA
ncbi:MAG: hypothetical protein HWN79_08400 [Candidatus Lokiarchaeota archaeon]|nr:hypothetical protein [Candidatus Lokiarchaeota archaeon]